MQNQAEMVHVGCRFRMLRSASLGMQGKGPTQLHLCVLHVTQFVRKPAQFTQVIGQLYRLSFGLTLKHLDVPLQIIPLPTKIDQAGHKSGASRLNKKTIGMQPAAAAKRQLGQRTGRSNAAPKHV